MRTSALIPAALAVIFLQACTLTVRDGNPYKPTATLQEIMTSIIDPNIDYVWNSVSTVSTAQGTEERQPRTDEDWNAVRQHALTVVEASNLLLVKGRAVARKGANTSSGGAELHPEDIEKAIAAQRADFVKRTDEFHDAALRLIAAIDRKNADELVEAGGAVEHACEQCHSQFWYPNDKKPK
ncbi:cytochrome c [Methylococcus sp. EFPC2]|uniref:cytochrome c n=1 Tax=Methylococcus sp. EFPC2 TaxID=2812648 RepID=UPI0019686766|nr:cytochrome c [Methylococcus sp. EFPC2]QSA95491.1 cytochrome c [Methylococcus sp. EFPC2]